MSDRRVGPIGFSTTGTRTVLGYWVPLTVTVTVATIGLAAWVWSERSDFAYEEDEDRHGDRERGPMALEDRGGSGDAIAQAEDPGMIALVHGALRRTPSPQQIFDGASRRVVAARAAMGGALGAIWDGEFEDHSRWAEAAPEEVPRAVGHHDP